MQHSDNTTNTHQKTQESLIIEVGARSSPLSLVQVEEIYGALKNKHPHIQFQLHTMFTVGDLDMTTSLRTLGFTDFFTKEIDRWVLNGKGRVGIHSAKDLPTPLREGLTLFCLNQGLDSSDALVLRPNDSLSSLPSGAIIATSSLRREETVKILRDDFTFCDIRGTIGQRLAKLEMGEVDGVVIAEAALIRLGLTHLNRIRLPGTTAEGQGRLAVVGREEDQEIMELFKCLDARRIRSEGTCLNECSISG